VCSVIASPLLWALTIVFIVALLLFDFFAQVRKAHSPTLREPTIWSALYVGIAILFGATTWVYGGPDMDTAYLGGYVTEKALSVDNLLVFLIIMASFRVPRADQQKVLFGIVFSLAARTGFIHVDYHDLGGATSPDSIPNAPCVASSDKPTPSASSFDSTPSQPSNQRTPVDHLHPVVLPLACPTHVVGYQLFSGQTGRVLRHSWLTIVGWRAGGRIALG